jgi:methylmalonyl-CoA mutase
MSDEVAPTMPPLAAAFDAPDLERWRVLVDRVLDRSGTADRGELDARFDRTLVTRTYDGFTIGPLATRHEARPEPGLPGAAPFVRGTSAAGHGIGGWRVRQGVAGTDAASVADALLAELEGGATEISLRIGPGGLAPGDLSDALADVHLDLAGIALEPWTVDHAVPAADALIAQWRARLDGPATARGCLGLDPLGLAARIGAAPAWDDSVAVAAAHAVALPGVAVLVADGTAAHEAGGSDAEELGWVLASATATLRRLVEAGVPLDAAARTIELRVAATADQFATIAKIRALRRLWWRVTSVAGAGEPAQAARIHATGSWSMLSRRDPWVNLLRTTVAGFAAGVAGADAVTVPPFDAAVGRPDAFGRRLARNIQALLIEESNLARVADPAGGSWFVEDLTDKVAHASWNWFQEIEAAGGAETALADGIVEERLASTRARRAERIAHRRDPLTGVSEFPDVAEEPVTRPLDAERPGGGWPRIRYAEPFEDLRDRADAAAAAGAVPEATLLALGPVSASIARTTFAKNLLEAGGIRTTTATCPDVDAVDSAVRRGDVVCLCSSDAVYAEQAAMAVQAARQAGARRVLLAGRDTADGALTAAGVDEFLTASVDVLDVLDRTLTSMGARA